MIFWVFEIFMIFLRNEKQQKSYIIKYVGCKESRGKLIASNEFIKKIRMENIWISFGYHSALAYVASGVRKCLQTSVSYLWGTQLATLDETLTGMSCMRETCADSEYCQESSKELRLTLEINKSHFEKWPGALLTWFTAVFPGREWRLLFWEMAKKEPEDFWGDLRNLSKSTKSVGIAGKDVYSLAS